MDCPKCGFTLLDADPVQCTRCGVVIAKFMRAHQESRASAVELPPLLKATHAAVAPENESATRSERMARAVALPLALLFAWLAVRESPGAVRMLAMWVHESGHAVAAWLCGYVAWPGPWFTPVGTERSPSFTVLLVGLENENGLSDPSVLTEIYGWSLLTLISRYGQLAHACLALLVVVYVAAFCDRTSMRQ